MKRRLSKILGVGLTLALLFSLLLVAAPVSADVDDIEVDVDDNEISAQSTYIITFDINDELDNDADNSIEIRFAEGTILDDTGLADGDITIQTVSTFGNDNIETAVGDDATFTEDDDVWTVEITLAALPNAISENSSVRVEFTDDDVILNPDEPGMYTLEVCTSEEDDWVESEEYEIEIPDVDVLPGVAEVYNTGDILMATYTGGDAIGEAIARADEDWTIKVGAGEYTENLDTADAGVTIEGSGDLADIVIIGDWTIDEDDITLDNLTLEGDIDVTGDDFTLENCVVDEAGTLELDGIEATVEDTTFNVEDDTGIEVDADDAVISDCTFNIEEDGVGISVGEDGTDTDVSGCTFIGDGGVGIELTDDDSVLDVEDSTFDGLDTALDIDAGTLGATGNTIENCLEEAIIVSGATSVTLSGNTFTDNDEDDLLQVADDADNVYLLFNTITDNAGADDLLIDNNDADEDLIAANNWWGDAAGPGDDAFSDGVVSEPFLAGAISATAGIDADVAAGDTADFEDDVGVTVVAADDVMDVVAASQYLVNPVAAIDDAVGFWDVYVIGGAALDDVEIRIYTDVTEDTEVWVWGEARGEWLECTSYTPNLFSGFILVEVDDTSGTPTVEDLEALPFAVIEPPAAAGEIVAPTINAPVSGDDTVSLTPTFAWSPGEDADGEVADADGYYFELADNANFVLPLVKLDGDTGRLIVSAYAYVGELPYSSAYYWRVRAVTGTAEADDLVEGDWASAVFITMDEPVEPTPPVEIVEAPALPDITITSPDINITSPDIVVPLPAVVETPITPSWIYVIIGVGAVLVIALLVLIVRTRRVA